ncbi:MAG: HupE/UreJ family protein [Pseudomonadota bacterium]|nr:HupE/UreJ family protein [Pseudomonadota bacterium]
MSQTNTSRKIQSTFARIVLLFCCSIIGIQQNIGAHEIPSNVVINSYLKAHENTANLLVRVPLEAMRDMNFPITGPGYLQLGKMHELSMDAAEIWLGNFVDLYEGRQKIEDWEIAATRISLPSDRSFYDYASAYENIFSPALSNDVLLHHEQALLDVLITYPIKSRDSAFSIDLNFGGLGLNTTTIMTFISSEDVSRVYEFKGSPGLVELDPAWHNAFLRFVNSGIEHILSGFDHLLFILCLILPCRKLRSLIVIITSFTFAHSVTLIASAFGIVPKGLWFPPLIEMLIALSIVYMAIENIVRLNFEKRWPIAFGFGFSFVLSETMQFAGSHLLTSLFAFNLGVEIGQIALVCIAVPLMNKFFHLTNTNKIGPIIISVLIAHTAWHWMLDRFEVLSAYQYTNPINRIEYTDLISWGGLVLVILIVFVLLRYLFEKFLKSA